MIDEKVYIKSSEIDYSKLVGREIRIRSEQFPCRVLSARVVAVSDNNLVLDRSGSSGMIDQLIANQTIEISFDYKGEPVAFNSKIYIPRVGRLQVPIALDVAPQIKRQFVRLPVSGKVRMTFCDENNIGSARLSKLKWLETETMNIGGGGMLIGAPLFAAKDDYMIFHLEIENAAIPQLMVGRIRHKGRGENNLTRIGVEFIIREHCGEKLPNALLKSLPLKLFDFDERMRANFAVFLAQKYGNNQNKGFAK
jgi:hypothetical protein